MIFKNFKFGDERARQETSEKYRTHVKQFLDSICVKSDIIKKSTYQILYNVLTDFRLPAKGEQLRLRTQQQINLIALILKLIEVHGEIEQLYIATYTLNKEAFAILCDLLVAKKVQKLKLYLASSYGFRAPEEYRNFKLKMTGFKQQGYDIGLIFAWLHLKITLAQCGENYYQFEGSMNYSTNNMVEQLVFENRKETFDFDRQFLEAIVAVKNLKSLEIVC